MKNLVIVEASGKADSIRAKLRSIGLFAEVLATVGHVADNPRNLNPIALDSELRETSYAFRADRAALIEKIQRAAFSADRIFVAADDDQEGDAIAYDVSRFLSVHADKLFRVRLRAITEGELKESFSGSLSQEFEAPARNATCRRIVDRAIGATFTHLADHNTIPVGRVQSALLCGLEVHPPAVGHFHIPARLSDGETYWAKLPIDSQAGVDNAAVIMEALARGRAKLLGVAANTGPIATPWGYEEVVAEVAVRLKLDIEQAADAFQEAYERGRVSYPRLREGAFTQDAVEVAARIAANNRCGFNADLLSLRVGGGKDVAAHEAPCPTDEEMLLGRPLSVLEAYEAVAVLLARNVVECGQSAQVRQAKLDVEGQTVVLSRIVERPRVCWSPMQPERGYHPMPRPVALLRYMAEMELGRPSTVVSHVKKFLQRGLLEPEVGMRLNARGERWLAHAKSVGFSADSSARMEAAMAGPMADPHAQARAILQSNGMLPAVQGAIRAGRAAMVDAPCPEPF